MTQEEDDLQAPFRITLTLRGVRPPYVDSNLCALLDVLEKSSFAPDRWSLNERGALPYAREEIRALAARGEGRPLPQGYAYVKRSKAPKYDCRLLLSDRPGVELEPTRKLPSRQWESLFELADRLATICQPDWGACHVWYLSQPLEKYDEPSSVDHVDSEIVFSSALLAPVKYYDHGPESLVMRTFIGPHFVHQIGADRIRTLPLEVQEMDWGGYRVDLVPRPWTASLGELLGPWRKGMEQLRPAQVLAQPRVEGGRFRGFVKAPRCVIEGPA